MRCLKTLILLLGVCLYLAAPEYALALDSGDQIRSLGDDLQIALPAMAFSLTAIHRDKIGAFQFLKAGLTDTSVTLALKYTFPDVRPNGGPNSFPSGHTSISFTAAEFMRKRYGWKFGLPAYLAAGFVGFSRLDCKAHDFDDVAVGAVIGIASSYFFTEPYQGWRVQVSGNPKSLGVTLAHDW